MRKIHKTRIAESDLIGIWQYSFEERGETQADNYLDELDETIGLLAENPELGASRDHVREGYRVLFPGRHAVYYTVTASAILIVRVLHVRMDPDRPL